ncbi:MAG: hypothetical protein HQK96_19110, partial [Nitrospirae bacterium]|nr:hypothetical protein [Nitrospirota bacterium]
TEMALRISKVWYITMPFKGGGNYLKYIKKASFFMLGNNVSPDGSPEIHYYKLKLADDIQRSVDQEVSHKFNLPFIDLSHIVDSELSAFPVSAYVGLEYFYDFEHLKYRGSELLVDLLF